MKFQAKPLDTCFITQLFGQNQAPFYKQLGMKGHNGMDFRALSGTPTYAVFDGTVAAASLDTQESLTKGRYVYLDSDEIGGVKYRVVYFHLETAHVKTGDRVKAGQQIGLTDNTGQYTTAPHLHLGLYVISNGVVINQGNGYGGGLDPYPYFEESWFQNPLNKLIYADLLAWEGRLIKEENNPQVYWVKSGKIYPFPDELTVWSNGLSLARIDKISDGTLQATPVEAPVAMGTKIDPQILKEMVALFGNEPERAKTLFKKYFN